MKPGRGKTSQKPMKSENRLRPRELSSKTGPMAPAAGSDKSTDLLYGLHAIREALRAGTRPLQRLLVHRTDRQFADIVQQAKAKGIPVHIEPPVALDRLVPQGRHQGEIGRAHV